MNGNQQVSVRVTQAGSTWSAGTAREHALVMDRPEAKGGHNRGPLGGETFLMALGGCFMSNLLAAAKARELDVSNVQLSIAGTLGSAPPRYTDISMAIAADYTDRDQMEKVVTVAERGCVVANTLKGMLKLDIVLG